MNDSFDVIIVGGGPAGYCAALRLLKLGYKVALIEREVFPREQIGESLSPGIWDIFRYLQADHLLNDPQYLRGLNASVIWETRVKNTYTPEQRGYGVMVDRGKLDRDMLLLAVDRGLHLFQPAKFESCSKNGEQWQVELKEGSNYKSLKCKFVLDARGRRGTAFNNRILIAPPSVAIWTHVNAGLFPNETIVEAIERCWLWGSPVIGNQFRVMAFIDPEEIKTSHALDALIRLVSKSVLFRSIPESIQALKVKSCPVLTYSNCQPWEDNFIRLGESAFTLDPLSSSGVEKAMRNSLQAVIAINTVFRSGAIEIAKSFYEDRIIESIVTHSKWTRQYYAQAWPGENYSFWKNRSQYYLQTKATRTSFYERLEAKLNTIEKRSKETPLPTINVKEASTRLWHMKVRLSQDLTYLEIPCVVGDWLEIKKVIAHPNLERDIAYIEEVEIAPLLIMISKAEIFGELMHKWSRLIPFEQAVRIGVHLYSIGLLFSCDSFNSERSSIV